MESTTVRISRRMHETIQTIAAREGRSLQDVLARALESYRRQRFLDAVNAGYRELRGDAQAWSEMREEVAAWDGTLTDGLEPRKKSRRREAKR